MLSIKQKQLINTAVQMPLGMWRVCWPIHPYTPLPIHPSAQVSHWVLYSGFLGAIPGARQAASSIFDKECSGYSEEPTSHTKLCIGGIEVCQPFTTPAPST